MLTQWLTQPEGLATKLGNIRRTAELTGAGLAHRLGWVPSKVSRVQGGRILPTGPEVEAWCVKCGAPEAAAELVEMLADASAQHMPWRQRLARGHRTNQAAYTALNRKAEAVTMVESVTIPGPLQVPEYAAAVLAGFAGLRSELPSDDLAEAVAERMERAALVEEPARSYRFIIYEAALLGGLAPAAVMVDQLDRLAVVAGLPHLEVLVLPLRSGVGAVPVSSFGLYTVDGVELVLAESFNGETEHTLARDVAAHRQAVEWLARAGVSGPKAQALIAGARAIHAAAN